MFFADRIKNVKPEDRVLEIGPGSTPHPRSNVLLEKVYASKEEYDAQTGYNGTLKTDKKVVFYEGERFPFEDKSFDYIICSHVLEHVENVERFLEEITRVGKKGYLEFPTVYYDYLYNFSVHRVFLLQKDGIIYWMLKNETELEKFKIIQEFFYQTLSKNYTCLVDELKKYIFQGFEWEDSIMARKADSLSEVCYDPENISIPVKGALIPLQPQKLPSLGTKLRTKLAMFARSITSSFIS